MSVANFQASDIDFPALPGVFDPKYPKTSSSVGIVPFSGVMAEAVQTVSITTKVASDELLAVGTKGHAGFTRKFGGVDINIDAVLTDNAMASGAYGFQLSDFDNVLANGLSGLVLYTTNSTLGKKATVGNMYVNSITFNFNENATATTAWTFVADTISYDNWIVATSGAVGNRDFHCVDPLTWDEVHIVDKTNNIVLTGVQTATFTATINRSEIFQIGQFTPYDRAVQYPYRVSVTLNTLANDVALTNWWDKFVPTYDPMTDCAGGIIIKVKTNPITSDNGSGTLTTTTHDFIVASGLRPTNSTLNTAVGSNSTVALTFEGNFLTF